MNEDVPGPIRVTWDKIIRRTVEGNVAAVGGDPAREPVAKKGNRLRSVGAYVHALGDTCPAVVDEVVLRIVRITRNKIVRVADERHEAAVTRDLRIKAVEVTLRPKGIDTHESSRAKGAIMEEHVIGVVRICRNEVVGKAGKHHIATVVADRAMEALCIPLHTVGCDAYSLCRAVLSVTNEDIPRPVGIAGDKVVRGALENDVASIGSHRDGVAQAVCRSTARVDAHPLRHLCGDRRAQQARDDRNGDQQP